MHWKIYNSAKFDVPVFFINYPISQLINSVHLTPCKVHLNNLLNSKLNSLIKVTGTTFTLSNERVGVLSSFIKSHSITKRKKMVNLGNRMNSDDSLEMQSVESVIICGKRMSLINALVGVQRIIVRLIRANVVVLYYRYY